MADKVTKANLLEENAQLKALVEQHESKDKDCREELSKALGAGMCIKKNSYEDDKQYICSWADIFVRLGKLVAKRDYVDFQDKLDDIDNKAAAALDKAADTLENIRIHEERHHFDKIQRRDPHLF